MKITCLWLLLALPVWADQGAVDKAVARGVEFLVSRQDADGAIVTDKGNKQHTHALTSLSIMALSAVGHQPVDETVPGKALRKALEYMLANGRQDTNGYYGQIDGSMMYGHGIVTLMLAEMLGMGVDVKQDGLIRERCQKAVDLIVRSQKANKGANFRGGWRYQPASADADLSVTVWQVMALRAAKNAGLIVPKETIDEAVAYLRRSYFSPRDKDGVVLDRKSAFAYQPGAGPSYAMGSAGLLALQVCGEYDAPETAGATQWLREFKSKNAKTGYFYYGTYYYAQGMYQRGGDIAKEARQLVESLLLAEQKPDGSWQGVGTETSKIYATAMALMSLSVRHHFLPIYQR